MTPEITDDAPSDYSTGSDTTNPVQFYALADPVLFLMNKDQLQFLEHGGTSSAQPHLAAVYLLLKETNPTLTGEQMDSILRATLYPFEEGQTVGAVDPQAAVLLAAHFPGSSYQGDRLERLTQALGGLSVEEYQTSAQFREFVGFSG